MGYFQGIEIERTTTLFSSTAIQMISVQFNEKVKENASFCLTKKEK